MKGGWTVPGDGSSARRRRWWSTGGVGTALSVVLVLCAACGSATGGKAASTTTNKLKIQTVSMEVPSYGAQFVPFYYSGIFKKYGIKLDIIDLAPPTAVPAVQDGKIDFMTTVGTALASAAKGATLKVVDVQEDRLPWVIVGGKQFTKMSQLKGQTIIGESAVGEENLAEEAALQHAGVPITSVTFTNVVGGDSVFSKLLESGSGAATALDYGYAYTMTKQGYHILEKLTWLPAPAQGLATSTTLIRNHPTLVKHMVEAAVAATAKARTDKASTVALFEKAPFTFTKAKADYLWKAEKPFWTKDGTVPKSVQTAEAKDLQVQLSLSSPPNVSKYLDLSFLPKG